MFEFRICSYSLDLICVVLAKRIEPVRILLGSYDIFIFLPILGLFIFLRLGLFGFGKLTFQRLDVFVLFALENWMFLFSE